MLGWLLERAVLLALVVGVRSDCYSRDGTSYQSQYFENEQLISCGNGTNTCCLQGDKCGSNLLCTQGGGIGRQYCALKDWSSGCSELWPDINVNTGIGLVDCGENVFCYGSDVCCTDTTAELRYVNPLTGEVKSPQSKDADATKSPTWWKVDSVGILASMRTATASRTDGSSEATPTSTGSGTEATPQTTGDGDTEATPQTTGLPTPTTPAASSNESSSSGISAGVGAGIGVGATAAVVIIALLAWLFFRERRKRKALQGKGVVQEPAMASSMQQTQAGWKGPDTEYYAHEAPSDGRSELEQEHARYEMDGRVRPELA